MPIQFGRNPKSWPATKASREGFDVTFRERTVTNALAYEQALPGETIAEARARLVGVSEWVANTLGRMVATNRLSSADRDDILSDPCKTEQAADWMGEQCNRCGCTNGVCFGCEYTDPVDLRELIGAR